MSAPGGHQAGSRRGSNASSDANPFRQRRSSLSLGPSTSPASLPLAAAASINASMRGGSPGPATTARDDAASRRSSVAAELALADDKLPPPAEIAAADRKPSLTDNLGGNTSRAVPNLNTQSSTGSSGGGGGGGGGGSLGGSPTDAFKTRNGLRDPLANVPEDATRGAHHRAPSIGQVHQEMEQEQEAQVNRLLVTIHQQQQQIESLQRRLETASGMPVEPRPATPILSSHLVERVPSSSSSALGVSTPGGDHFPPPTPQRAHSTSSAGTTVASNMPAAEPGSAAAMAANFARPSAAYIGLSHRPSSSSRGSSRAASPGSRLARKSSADGDENRFYWQAEAGNLGKENELLKQKIRELEKQLREGKDDGTKMAID